MSQSITHTASVTNSGGGTVTLPTTVTASILDCTVTAVNFRNVVSDIISSDGAPNVASVILEATNTPSTCPKPITYTRSPIDLPAWLSYSSVTQTFTINSSTSTPSIIVREAIITFTATV